MNSIKNLILSFSLVPFFAFAQVGNNNEILKKSEWNSFLKSTQNTSTNHLKTIDSLQSIISELQKSNSDKFLAIEDVRVEKDIVKQNFQLFNAFLKAEKTNYKNLQKDSVFKTFFRDTNIVIQLSGDVNIKAIEEILGKKNVENQLPILYEKIKEGSIVIQEGYPESALPKSGMSLPDWPVGFNLTDGNQKLQNIYLQQENWINTFSNMNECGASYYPLFVNELRKKTDLKERIILQLRFKQFLEKKCK